MTTKRVEPDDPLELVGVELPADSDESMIEMAETFAEEFARTGWSEDQVLSLFRNPAYAAPHRVWRIKGEDEVVRIVRKAMSLWRPGYSG